MARHAAFRQMGAAGELRFNVTPMIDCVFQLIIFFIIASQVASKSLPAMALHRPEASRAIPSKDLKVPNRVTVNVLSAEGEAREENPVRTGKAERYEIDGNPIAVGDVVRLAEFMRRRRGLSGAAEFYVEIRADRRINFQDIQPIMLAAAEAKIVRVHLTALTATEDN